jgi:aspartate/methionine/tyrosine aminotransferase
VPSRRCNTAGPGTTPSLQHLHRLRDYCVERLDAIPSVSCKQPDATFVLFPDISATGSSSQQLADLLLTTARVTVVPGTPEWFDPAAEGHIRLSFATSQHIIAQALDRIEETLATPS